jgi:hypothetical protein
MIAMVPLVGDDLIDHGRLTVGHLCDGFQVLGRRGHRVRDPRRIALIGTGLSMTHWTNTVNSSDGRMTRSCQVGCHSTVPVRRLKSKLVRRRSREPLPDLDLPAHHPHRAS